MSVTNLGTQTINWKYKTSLKGSNLSKMFNGCINPGIYLNNGSYIASGTGLVTSFAANQITINAFTAIFKASSTQTVHISTASPIMLSTDGGLGYITEAAPYITMSYSWADQIINYIDFAFKAVGDIATNDLVIGKAVFTGANVTSIDYSVATYPPVYNPSTQLSSVYSDLLVGGVVKPLNRNMVSVTITTADVTLTSNQSYYNEILLSGTLTGNRNLILPTDVRKYKIINTCTGSYSVYVKTASGTGIYLLSGDIKEVYCTGVNITPAEKIDYTSPKIEGLIISNNTSDVTNDINLSTGYCNDSTRTSRITNTVNLTKRLDATWEAGTNAGMLQSGQTKAGSKSYRLYLIASANGLLVDLIATEYNVALVLPSGYTRYRYIGSIRTLSGGAIQRFEHLGNEFILYTDTLQVGESMTTGTITKTITVIPLGLTCPIIRSSVAHGVSGAASTYVNSLLPDSVAGAGIVVGASYAEDGQSTGLLTLNASYTVQFVISGTGNRYMYVNGYIDRDREAF